MYNNKRCNVFNVLLTGGVENKPTEKLNIQGETFEEQCVSLVKDVFEPAGFTLECFTRVPYLCEGDLEKFMN